MSEGCGIRYPVLYCQLVPFPKTTLNEHAPDWRHRVADTSRVCPRRVCRIHLRSFCHHFLERLAFSPISLPHFNFLPAAISQHWQRNLGYPVRQEQSEHLQPKHIDRSRYRRADLLNECSHLSRNSVRTRERTPLLDAALVQRRKPIVSQLFSLPKICRCS